MNVSIEESWKQQLSKEFEKDYFKSLVSFVKQEYQLYTCYPPGLLIFNAFNHCAFNDVKVVIIGQDPYHQPNQANGLCFSVQDGITHPPSLKNIFKEIKEDCGNISTSGNLESWANQGVLLLNAVLSVRQSEAGSHQKKGWEQFTDAVISNINKNKEGVVFMLWGGYAKKKGKIIDRTRHLVLEANHPSPLSANRGGWFGTKHFSKANDYLNKQGSENIKW